jgi:hypothetical protein
LNEASAIDPSGVIDRLGDLEDQAAQANGERAGAVAAAAQDSVARASGVDQVLADTTASVQRINEMAAQSATACEEQSSVTEEIARNITISAICPMMPPPMPRRACRPASGCRSWPGRCRSWSVGFEPDRPLQSDPQQFSQATVGRQQEQAEGEYQHQAGGIAKAAEPASQAADIRRRCGRAMRRSRELAGHGSLVVFEPPPRCGPGGCWARQAVQ